MSKPAKALYSDSALIESTLRACGVDPMDESTWHRIKSDQKAAVATKLAESAKASGIDAEPAYARQAIDAYFGERRRVARRKV